MKRQKKADFAREHGISKPRVTKLVQDGRLGTVGAGRKQEIDLDDPQTIETILEIRENRALRAQAGPRKTITHYKAGAVRFQTLEWPSANDNLSIETFYPLSEGLQMIESGGAGVAVTQTGVVNQLTKHTEGCPVIRYPRLAGTLPAWPGLPPETNLQKVTDDTMGGGRFLFVKIKGRWVPFKGLWVTDTSTVQLFFPLSESLRLFTPEDGAPWVEGQDRRRHAVYAG